MTISSCCQCDWNDPVMRHVLRCQWCPSSRWQHIELCPHASLPLRKTQIQGKNQVIPRWTSLPNIQKPNKELQKNQALKLQPLKKVCQLTETGGTRACQSTSTFHTVQLPDLGCMILRAPTHRAWRHYITIVLKGLQLYSSVNYTKLPYQLQCLILHVWIESSSCEIS